MGLFSKLGKMLSGNGKTQSPAQEAEAMLQELSRDNRVHSRYMIQGDGVAQIFIENGGQGNIPKMGLVRDLSYGGMAVRFDTDGRPLELGNEVKGRMKVLDQEIMVKFSAVRTVGQSARTLFVGCVFLHEAPDTLVFLREVIEPLRCGKSLVNLGQDMRNEKYRGEEWVCLRGDGPTDLLLRSKPESLELEEALLTFRNQDSYREVSFNGGRLKTGRSAGSAGDSQPSSPGAQMANTAHLDKASLRHAAFVLAGAPTAVKKQIEPLLKLILQALNVDVRDIAA